MIRVRYLFTMGLLLLAVSCTPLTNTDAPIVPEPSVLAASVSPTAFDALPPTATPLATPPPPSTQTPEVGCAGGLGRTEETAYPAAVASGDVPVRLYLPACYDEPGRRFPAVYLFHGKPFTETHWESIGAVNLLAAKIEQGEWPPILLIMPLLPEPQFSDTDGGPRSYEAEFVEGLLAFVDSNYKTLPRAEYRAVAGISRGGIWSLVIGLSRPDLVERIASLSPSLAVNYPRPEYDPFVMAADLDSRSTLVYLAAGENDWARAESERLSELMNREGVFNVLQIVGGGHDGQTWTASLDGMFDFLVAGWPSS